MKEKKKIFISYCHEDETWKERLTKQLKVLELEKYYTVWEDRQIKPGEDWLPRIECALNEASAAILLVSADFLISSFIREKEVPKLLKRREEEGITVIPLILHPCQWQKVEWLSKIQTYPADGRPLSGFSEYEQKTLFSEMAGKIADMSSSPSPSPMPNPIPPKSPVKTPDTHLLTPLPVRNIDLIGRAEALRLLEQKVNRSRRVLLVNGIGGIGKTELCKAFFNAHYRHYSRAAWVDVVSSIKDSVIDSFHFDTDKVMMAADDTPEQRFQKIDTYLHRQAEPVAKDEYSDGSGNPDTLLVLDNIGDVCDMAPDPGIMWLKRLPAHIKVIANSRRELPGFDCLELEFLSEAECLELFYRYYHREKHDKMAAKLVKRCGSHTLTVELLARTGQNARLSLRKLSALLEEKGFNLNSIIGDKVETFWHDETKRKRFFDHLLSLYDISNLTEAELKVLENMAVLPPDFIDTKDVKDWLKLEDYEPVTSLVSKGWLREEENLGGDGVFLHQVLQEVIRYHRPPDVRRSGTLIDSLKWKLYLEPGDNPLDKKGLVRHSESILHFVTDADENIASLANNLSVIYQAMGDTERALKFQLKDVEISEKVLGKNHPDLATSYNNISMIYQDQGDLGQALEFQLKTVTIFETVLDKNHPDLAKSYNNVSIIYQAMGDLERTLGFQLKALSIRETVLVKNHPDLAQSYNNIGTIYYKIGDLKQALEFQLKALRIDESTLSKNHPDLATSYHNVSSIHQAMGDLEQALRFSQNAVGILQRLFPNGHPNLDLVKRNLEMIKKKV